MNNTMSIFDYLYPKYKITKPIRLIEFFAGYGSQALALKYLGVPFEHWKICEWAVKSIQAYKDIHFTNKYYWKNVNDCSISKEILVDTLFEVGISSNYNEPMTREQTNRLSYEQLVRIYENILITNNLVNIQGTKGKDLEIEDTDKYEYVMTYSFPCQDLSLAGKGKGMSDTSTRSGMIWEVERILTECHELGTMPQILLMENVPQVHGADNVEDFNKWKLRLEELGYKNYFQDLIATDYGIPQTRNRCFMVSILGDYNYVFPKPIPLKLKLKDLLEENVDEKYYLSDAMLNYLHSESSSGFSRKECFERIQDKIEKSGIAATITTAAGTRATDNFINESNMKTELCNNLIKDGKVKENDVIRHNYTTSKDGNCIQTNNEVPTLDTRCDCLGVVINNINSKANHQQDIIQDSNGNARTLVCGTHGNGGHYTKTLMNDLRIRKLTPKECFRLMGVKDEDYEKCAKNQSDSSLYHLAGDSIVVNVLMAIFKELIGE